MTLEFGMGIFATFLLTVAAFLVGRLVMNKVEDRRGGKMTIWTLPLGALGIALLLFALKEPQSSEKFSVTQYRDIFVTINVSLLVIVMAVTAIGMMGSSLVSIAKLVEILMFHRSSPKPPDDPADWWKGRNPRDPRDRGGLN